MTYCHCSGLSGLFLISAPELVEDGKKLQNISFDIVPRLLLEHWATRALHFMSLVKRHELTKPLGVHNRDLFSFQFCPNVINNKDVHDIFSLTSYPKA